MVSQKLFSFSSIIIALIVHVGVFVLLIFGLQVTSRPNAGMVDPIKIVQAEVLDGAAIEAEKKRIRQEQAELERQRRELALKKQREKERQQRLALEAKQREEQKRQAEIKEAQRQKKLAEQARIAAEKAKKQAEIQAEQERKRAEENARKLAEALKKQEQDAEQKRLDAILAEEEAQMRTAEEQFQKAARQRQLNTMLSQYIGAISNKIQSRWRKPAVMENQNVYCIVYVEQALGGYIQTVDVRKCVGGDEQLRKSVEEAVWKSDPLPSPPDAELFQRELKITFEPK